MDGCRIDGCKVVKNFKHIQSMDGMIARMTRMDGWNNRLIASKIEQ